MAVRKFALDRRNAKFMGVCAGIADYFNIDATWVRIGAVVTTLLGAFPWTLIVYGLAAWLAKPKPAHAYEAEDIGALGGGRSTWDLNASTRDIDRRMAEVERYVASSNPGLASEIDKLR